MCSGGQTVSAPAVSSCHQWSLPSTMATVGAPSAPLVRRATITWSMDGVFCRASSALALRGTTEPLRQPPSAVMRTLASASLMRSRRASAEKPPNTTEWAAPILVQASMATGSSGIIGM